MCTHSIRYLHAKWKQGFQCWAEFSYSHFRRKNKLFGRLTFDLVTSNYHEKMLSAKKDKLYR